MIKNTAIITAGGMGKRLGGTTKKQFIEIEGRLLLFRTIDNFAYHPFINKIIITLPADEIDLFENKIKDEYPENNITIISGGKERQDSVYNALKSCDNDTDFVLIHDGVRPFISGKEITEILNMVQTKGAVLPVISMQNTVKKIEGDKVVTTVPRDNLVNALTPQAFQFDTILQCHEKAKKAGLYFTDDTAILEHYDFQVYIIYVSEINFKITNPSDLKMADMIIKNNVFSEDKSF
jgi:2-C-methyl-D-erythritol 4-phosphate cytidylyltransferase